MKRKLKTQYFSTLILSVLFLLILIPGAHQAVQAQSNGDVKLTVHAGFAGNCKENRWIPLRVTVENKGADLNGRIQVAYQNNSGGQAGYGIDLSLPASSRKEFFLYLHPDGYFQKLNVNLTVDDRMVVSTPFNPVCIASDGLIVGLLTDSSTAFKSLSGFTRISPLKLTDLPDRAQGWEALDALIISGVDTSAINDQQRSALKIWLAQGGKLLVTGGPKWQGITSGLDEFLPLTIKTTQSVSTLSALQNYFQSSETLDTSAAILAVGQLRPKATVLVTQDNVTVLAQKQIGHGSVYYLAADPTIEPLSTWAGMSSLYEQLLAAPTLHPVWLNNTWDNYPSNQALAALPALGLPPTIYVLCLLGVYILIIGPINYLILRAIKRQEWAWVSIPVLVIGFTVIGYFSGYWIRGTRPILNRLAIVQAWDDVDLAQATGLVGIYSPSRTGYTLQAGNGVLVYPFNNNNGGQSLQANQGWFSLQKDSQILLPDVLIEAGGMKSAFINGSVRAITFKHDLVLTLDDKKPMLSGTITNTSQHAIKDAVLMMAGNSLKLGDFAPGAVKKVQILLDATPKGTELYDFQGQSMYSSYNYSNQKFDDKAVRESAMMQAILSGRQNPTLITSGIYLVGWLEGTLLPTGLQGQGFDSIDTTFYILNLSPEIARKPGELKLTPSLFSWHSSNAEMAPYLPQYPPDIPESGYILTFKLTAPLQYSAVKSLTLNLSQGNGSTREFNAFVWNWKTSEWVQFEITTWGNQGIPEPTSFVAAGGEIKLKITKNNTSTQNQNPIGTSYFTLVVQP